MARSNSKSPAPKTRRINRRGFYILGGVLLAIGILYFPIRAFSNQMVRRSALNQAKEITARGDVDLAVRNLDRYLATWPEDIEALEELAKLRADSARNLSDLGAAANLNNQLLRLDPEGKKGSEGKGRNPTRRRLVKLWVTLSDYYRAIPATNSSDATEKVKQYRYQAAKVVVQDLLARGEDDAEVHQLYAMVMDGMHAAGDPGALELAIQEYNKSLKLDPKNATSAERLAEIYLIEKKDLVAADRVLDSLLQADPDSPKVRISRYRAFNRANQPVRAAAEIALAIAQSPDDATLRIAAANDALDRNDLVEARKQLATIPPAFQNEPQIRLARARLELVEKHPELAIDEMRKGLAAVGGSDQNLTFRLAYTMIQLGRFSEARPLVIQFQRLQSEQTRPIGLFLKGLLDQRTSHPAQAIESLEKARARIPEFLLGDLLVTLGRSYELLGDEASAMIVYRSAVNELPKSVQPRQAIARLLQNKDPKGAYEEINRLLSQSPTDPALIFDAGRLQLMVQLSLPPKDRNWQRLEDLLEQGGGRTPRSFALRLLWTEYLIATNRAVDAVNLMEESAKGPDRKIPEAWQTWAGLLEKQGKREAALKVLDDAMAADAAGDHASLRIAKSGILVRAARGQAARDALTKGTEKLPASERPAVAHALGDLLRDLGDREGSRMAYLEWSRLNAESPEPGLSLLTMGQLLGDDDAIRLGQETLRGVGGDREPYGLAAQALELLRTDPAHPGPPSTEKLDRAERYLAQIQTDAPELALGHQLRGTLLEHRDRLLDASKEYQIALADERMGYSMLRLIDIYTRLKMYDDLAALKRRFEQQAQARNQTDASSRFDQLSAAAALKSGDREKAEFFASKIVEKLPDSLQARASLAQILDQIGKPKEAEATLQALVDRLPNDQSAWIALVSFQALKGNPEDAKKTIERARKTFKGDRIELLLGRAEWLCGRLPEAATQYSAGLVKRPDDPITLREAAVFDASTGQLGKLDAILRRAMTLPASATWASRELANRLSAKGDPADWAEAWSLVEPGSKTSSESPEDRLLRAAVLARSPDSTRRAEALPSMIALAQDLPASNPVAIEARIRLAQLKLDNNQPAEAAAFIGPVADDERINNPVVLALSIESLSRSGKGDEARSRLDRLVVLEPKSPRTMASKAWILQSEGKTPEAVALIEATASEVEPSAEGEAVNLAFFEMLRKMEDIDALERMATRIAARWPRDSYLLAQIQFMRKDYDKALASARSAMDAGSPREALRIFTGVAVARSDDPVFLKEVEGLAEIARGKLPKSVDVLTLQATIRHLQTRYEDELVLYREAIALNPLSVSFLNNMAWTLSEGLSKPEEALARIDEAIKRIGRDPQFMDTRGVILLRLGQFNQAIADLESAVKVDHSPTTYFHLARAYFKAGRIEDSRKTRELAKKAKFDPSLLDRTDRTDLDEVMLKNP